MVWTKLLQSLVALSAPLLLELVMIPAFLTTAQAQTKTPTQTPSASRLKQVTFEPRKDQPAPTVTVGGGRRYDGKCLPEGQASGQSTTEAKSLDQLLTPLLPSPFTDLQLTVSAHPTFLVYVPQTSAKAVELTLFARDKDKGEKPIYQTSVNLSGTPGIVSITLPATAPDLEMGKDYKWIVALTCQAGGPTLEDPFVEALIRRIQPDSALTQLAQAKPLDRVALYAKSGSWYDALANLAELRKAQPNNTEVASAWKELMQGAGLDAIANAPLMK